MIKPSEVVFANDILETEFNRLDDGEDLKKFLKRAIRDIQKNAFCGVRIPKKLIPKKYVQEYKINNLWKYDLPDGWRLIYSIVTPNKIEILAVIMEWFDHKNYERRFKY